MNRKHIRVKMLWRPNLNFQNMSLDGPESRRRSKTTIPEDGLSNLTEEECGFSFALKKYPGFWRSAPSARSGAG
jgi:hypothetical protein